MFDLENAPRRKKLFEAGDPICVSFLFGCNYSDRPVSLWCVLWCVLQCSRRPRCGHAGVRAVVTLRSRCSVLCGVSCGVCCRGSRMGGQGTPRKTNPTISSVVQFDQLPGASWILASWWLLASWGLILVSWGAPGLDFAFLVTPWAGFWPPAGAL